MGKFTKKAVTIEAVRFDGAEPVDDVQTPMFDGSFDVLPEWLHDAMAKSEKEEGAVWLEPGWSPPQLQIFTLEGIHRAQPGDWIIRGVKGELYPCKPDIFAASYDPAEG
jgi:hypothetical protein